MRRLIVLSVLGVALAARTLPAAEPNERLREFLALDAEVQKHFQARDYERAAETCRKMIGLAPRQPSPHYNLACALARLGKTEEALAALDAATQRGFGRPEHMKQDDDLASLRPDPRFAKCVERARENETTGGAAYEPGQDLPGVRSVEGSPKDGFRYRLRMSPAATADKPHRLILWLHPSGGSANGIVEALSPRFASLGFALLVLTQKNWLYWSGPDAGRLLEGTLPEAAKTPGIDARRPLLMGYSAGGQMALTLWHASPDKFGGLILDAAYPVRQKPGGYDALPLPEGPAVKQTPIFVLVGETDGGSKLWRKLEEPWRQAGVPLAVTYVPGKGHAWLFGAKELDSLGAWLEQFRAGATPKAAPPAPEH